MRAERSQEGDECRRENGRDEREQQVKERSQKEGERGKRERERGAPVDRHLSRPSARVQFYQSVAPNS